MPEDGLPVGAHFAISVALDELALDEPAVYREAVRMVKEPDYQPSPDILERLRVHELVDDNLIMSPTIHTLIDNTAEKRPFLG